MKFKNCWNKEKLSFSGKHGDNVFIYYLVVVMTHYKTSNV